MQGRAEKDARWKIAVTVAAVTAPAAAVLWLGLTLSAGGTAFHLAVVKIVYTIAVVLTALAGIRWSTASGVALLAEAALVVLWVALKIGSYSPYGAARTLILLAVPVAACGVAMVLAGGMRAGTWPPRRA